jgi:hypothetical protein
LLIDVIFREIENLKENCVSETLMIEYCNTLIVMIKFSFFYLFFSSPLWEEYEAFNMAPKLKKLMKDVIASKGISKDIKVAAQEVYDVLFSFG